MALPAGPAYPFTLHGTDIPIFGVLAQKGYRFHDAGIMRFLSSAFNQPFAGGQTPVKALKKISRQANHHQTPHISESGAGLLAREKESEEELNAFLRRVRLINIVGLGRADQESGPPPAHFFAERTL
jgi:hypothetical protein